MSCILLVADAPWVVNDVRAALAEARYTITEIADPRAVSAAVIADRPDAVVVDFQVGSMGGMAVTRSVRDSFAAGEAPPVILLLDRDADGFLAGRSGAAGSVRKPFGAADLRRIIDEHLHTVSK